MTKSKKNQKPKHPPLKPHFESNIYGDGVAIVRIPKTASQAERNKAKFENLQLAKKHSSYYVRGELYEQYW